MNEKIKKILIYIILLIIFVIFIILSYLYITSNNIEVNDNLKNNNNLIKLVEEPKTVKEKQKQIFKELKKNEDDNIDYKEIKNEQLDILKNL